MKRSIIMLLLIVLAFVKQSISQQGCHQDIYLKIGNVESAGVWVHCTEEEPNGNSEYIVEHQDESDNYYSVFELVKGTPYNTAQGTGEVETFWFWFGCCGISPLCVDDANQSNVNQGGLVLKNVNICWETTVYVDMMSQCEDCNDSQILPLGNWWKYETEFQENALLPFTSPNNPLIINLRWQGLTECSWSVGYGCESDEITGNDIDTIDEF